MTSCVALWRKSTSQEKVELIIHGPGFIPFRSRVWTHLILIDSMSDTSHKNCILILLGVHSSRLYSDTNARSESVGDPQSELPSVVFIRYNGRGLWELENYVYRMVPYLGKQKPVAWNLRPEMGPVGPSRAYPR